MLNKEEFTKIILDGIIVANSDYFNMSGLTIMESGVEFLMSYHIAKKLFSYGLKKDHYAAITLETSPENIRYYGDLKRRKGRPRKSDRDNGRVDIVYYNRSDKPFAVIEVKRFYSALSAKNDIDRLEGILRTQGLLNGGKIRHASFAFSQICHSDRAKERSISRVKAFKEMQLDLDFKIKEFDKKLNRSIIAFCCLVNVSEP